MSWEHKIIPPEYACITPVPKQRPVEVPEVPEPYVEIRSEPMSVPTRSTHGWTSLWESLEEWER